MPLKPHPTDPDKMVYASPHYDLPDTPTARAYLAKVLEDEDDDIQVYKRPWVGLTDEEVELYWDWEDFQTGAGRSTILEMVRDIEAKLKEKNT